MKKNPITLSNRKVFIILLAITFLGAIVRIINISPFKLYPDSYQSLIVAENILDYRNVFGYLGAHGMSYPDFFSWTHPIYPILIALVSQLNHDMTFSAQLIALTLGILAIPLTFFVIKQIFYADEYGLAGALLMALSFTNTLWSGFIMTEAAGVFFMQLFLLSFFAAINKKTNFINRYDLLTGLFFALAVLTRYEYAVISLPFIFYSLVMRQPFIRIVSSLASFIIIMSLFFIVLFPHDVIIQITSRLQEFSIIVVSGIMVLAIFLIVFYKFFRQNSSHFLKASAFIILVLLYGFVTILLAQLIFGVQIFSFIFVQDFLFYEITISLSFLLGVAVLLLKKQQINMIFFVLFSCLFLLFFYYHTNPGMDRYMTHLTPFLIIPGSVGLIFLFNVMRAMVSLKVKTCILTTIIIVFLVQLLLTSSGMRYSQDASWYRSSYEDKAAILVKPYLKKSDVLLVSYPEPYYYSTGFSVQSLIPNPPFIYLDNLPAEKSLLIVEDMGMHDYFPKFTIFLDSNMQSKKIASFWVHEKFHFIEKIQEERNPVVLYRVKLDELKKDIAFPSRK